MPSRNKKNKNRAQPPTTSGTSASKNDAIPVKIGEDSVPSSNEQPESKPQDLKFTITVAKEKLDQLQQTVNSIKASIAQSDAAKTDAQPTDEIPNAEHESDDKSEQPFETQTMKKKRNRNRNRNRNKNAQTHTTDESGVSSTSGTNENSTHENSPSPAVLTAIALPTRDVITSEITEEPAQVDSTDSTREIDRNATAVTKKIDVIEIQSSPKIAEILSQPTESEAQITESSVKIKKCSTVESETIALIETSKADQIQENVPATKPDESQENVSASKQDEKTNENKNEQLAKESDKRSKENEKQKKNNRQTKNNNKNSKEMPKVEPQTQNENKIDSNANLEKTDTIETKDDLPETKNVSVSAEPKNKNNKTVKENKKSPKMNKTNQSNESEPMKTEQIKLAEPSDIASASVAEKKIDGDDSAPLVQKIESSKETVVESVALTSNVTKESIQPEEQLPTKQIALPSDVEQIKTISQESNADDQKPSVERAGKPEIVVEKQQQVESESKEEIKENMLNVDVEDEKNKPETKQQTVEAKQQSVEVKPSQPPSGSPKESKKSKGKKSPSQPKVQNEQKQINAKEKSSEKHEPVPETNNLKPNDSSSSVDVSAIESSKEVKSNEPSKELPTKFEKDSVKIDAPSEEKRAEESKDVKPTSNLVTVKSDSTPNEPIASTSKVPSKSESDSKSVQPKIESETKKSETNVSSTNDEVTKTPATTPILTTPAPEASKKPITSEDETAKIWKILEEASKSLEPVEIEMEDPLTPKMDPTPVEVPVMCSSKDDQQTKADTQELVTILEAKEPIKSKPGVQQKVPKSKENTQQPKQSSPTKTIDPQPKKTADAKKKESKPVQKSTKPNKASPPQKSSTPEKTPEKIVAIAETPPPIEVSNEAIAIPIEEVPLDVSIMPNEIEVAELNADSKNVQGSDFVPSVEQSAAETKSLVSENDLKAVEQVQSMPDPEDSKSKSKSPINLKKEKPSEVKQTKAETTTSNENGPETNEAVKKEENNKKMVENSLKPSTEPTQKSQSKSPSKSVSPEKNKQPNLNNKPKETNAKIVQGKVTQNNNKKANGKPVVPPKPDNLVSSQAKKTQTVKAKSETTIKPKTEKVLVLTGNIEDDDSEDDYIEYKFMPRQVFIPTICQACKKPTSASERIFCQLCQMVSYCCAEHGANDEPIHKDLCAALQEIAKKRGGHIYNNARILNNNDYRSLRVHTLNLCENFLKRPLQTFEREILLFPRLCSTPTCREWRQNLLTDCPGCGQVFYCTAQPEHLIESHQRWCKSVALYQKLVVTQSVSGRIEPSLPSRIQTKPYTLPNNIGDVFKDLYKNYSAIKDECVFATLTQLATAPLTAYFAAQKAGQQIGEKFTIHLIGAELQFEADVLDIWETFFLHLASNLMELTVVFCGPELNAENIPLDIISRIRMCRACRQNCRIVKFDFQCAKFYHDYAKSSAYSKPDLICFFNPGFHHINSLNGLDTWSETIKIASSSGCPVVVTSYTEYESPRDLDRFQTESANGGKQMTLIHGPEFNVYSSQRPERNFISDEIVPLIFKNYFCFIMK